MGGAGSHRFGRGRLDPGDGGPATGRRHVGKATNKALAGRGQIAANGRSRPASKTLHGSSG